MSYTQEEIANKLVEKGLMEHCSQSTVSRLLKKAKKAVGELATRDYKLYVRRKLKHGYRTYAAFGFYDIKQFFLHGVIESGPLKGGYSYLTILYENNDLDVVGAKCFFPYDNVAYLDKKDSFVKPAVEAFKRLHKGEEITLPNGLVWAKNDHRVGLVLLFAITYLAPPYNEFFKYYDSPEKLPHSIHFSMRNAECGVIYLTKWE